MRSIQFFGGLLVATLLSSPLGVTGGPISSRRGLVTRQWKINIDDYAPGEPVHCGIDDKAMSCSEARDHCGALPDEDFGFKLDRKDENVGKDGGIKFQAYRAGGKGTTKGSQRQKCLDIVNTCCKGDTMTAGFAGWDKGSSTKGGGFILSSA